MTTIDSASPQQGIKVDWVLFVKLIHHALHIPEDCVEKFLIFIDCHPSLRALITIADNLRAILPIAQRLTDNRQLKYNDLPPWLQICEYLFENSERLSTEFPEINHRSSDAKRAPFPRQFELYPLYVALWYCYPDSEHQHRYCLLQAVLLLSHNEFRHLEENDEKDFTSPTRESTRLIRQCAESTHPEKVWALKPLIQALPEQAVSLAEYLEFIYTLEEDEDFRKEPLIHTIDVLRRMLRYAVEHRGGYNRRQNRAWEAILKREAARETIIAQEPDDLQGAAFSIESISMFSQTEKQEEKARVAGCAPGEVKTGVEHVIIHDDSEKSPMAGRSPVAHLRRCREKHKNIAMANQQLPSRWDCLTAFELSIFLHEVSNLARRSSCENEGDYEISNLELAALFTALYWTGSSLNTVIMAKFDASKIDSKSTLEANEL